MNSDKILVVYFSRSGETKTLAREISQKLNCALEEIKPLKSYSGILGYQRALLQALFKRTPDIRPLQNNINDFELVILGSPVWNGSLSGPARSFIAKHKSELKNVAFFATQGGKYGQKKIFEQMKNYSEKTPLAVLSVTDKEISSGTYKNSVSSFVSKLNLRNPKIEKRRLADSSRPEANI